MSAIAATRPGISGTLLSFLAARRQAAQAPSRPRPARSKADEEAAWLAARERDAHLDGHGRDPRAYAYGAGPTWLA